MQASLGLRIAKSIHTFLYGTGELLIVVLYFPVHFRTALKLWLLVLLHELEDAVVRDTVDGLSNTFHFLAHLS